MTSDIILKYFPDLTAEQQQQYRQLPELYQYWNSQINVISRKDIDLLFERHVLHSLGIAKVISFLPGENVITLAMPNECSTWRSNNRSISLRDITLIWLFQY